jgi:DNA-binding IclR family transcriptional regulator
VAGGPDAARVNDLDDLARELDLMRARAAHGTGKAKVSLADLADRVQLARSTVHSYVMAIPRAASVITNRR